MVMMTIIMKMKMTTIMMMNMMMKVLTKNVTGTENAEGMRTAEKTSASVFAEGRRSGNFHNVAGRGFTRYSELIMSEIEEILLCHCH